MLPLWSHNSYSTFNVTSVKKKINEKNHPLSKYAKKIDASPTTP